MEKEPGGPHQREIVAIAVAQPHNGCGVTITTSRRGSGGRRSTTTTTRASAGHGGATPRASPHGDATPWAPTHHGEPLEVPDETPRRPKGRRRQDPPPPPEP